jgi:hypothetical protein
VLCADFFLVLRAENPAISELTQRDYAVLQTRSRTLTFCTFLCYCTIIQILPTKSRTPTVTLFGRNQFTTYYLLYVQLLVPPYDYLTFSSYTPKVLLPLSSPHRTTPRVNPSSSARCSIFAPAPLFSFLHNVSPHLGSLLPLPTHRLRRTYDICPAHIRSSRGAYLSSFEYDGCSDRPCPSSLELNLLLARISSVTSDEPTCHLLFPHRSRINLNILEPIQYTPDDGKMRRPGALGASTLSCLQT